LSKRSATLPLRCSDTRGASRGAPAALGLVAVLLLAGCQGGGLDASFDAAIKKVFQPRRTPQQYLLIAVSDPDPDIRRASLAKVAESRQHDHEWAIKGYVAIALLENDPHVRCVAVRALGQTGDPRAVETCLKLLNYRNYPPKEVFPPEELCRADATGVLADAAAGALPEATRGEVLRTLRDRLRSDADRAVRIAAARGLRNFSELDVLRELIAGLRDQDFTVAHECEQSLAWLTGVTHDGDAFAWERWLSEHQADAFAGDGVLPASRRPPYEGAWGRRWYDTKQTLQWLFPGGKEQ